MIKKSIAVEFKNVSKWYGQFLALASINLNLHHGEKMVICGPSGSGKSTLIRCINALEDYQKGEISVNGLSVKDNLSELAKVRQSVGMVFQQFNLFGHLTVMQNLTLAPILVEKMPKKEAEKLAMHFLNVVKVSEQAEKYPSQLSGGQQQRVAIARSLCMKPEIMLFDEPTSALDPEMIREVLEVLVNLANDGMTMIIISHEMEFARQVADKMVFMEQGKIIEIGAPEAFFTHPQQERTKQFLNQILRR